MEYNKKKPHLVAVDEIIERGRTIIGWNSFGLENQKPELDVTRADVKVYQILVQSITEDDVTDLTRATTNLCESIFGSKCKDYELFRAFPRTDNLKHCFGAVETNKNSEIQSTYRS